MSTTYVEGCLSLRKDRNLELDSVAFSAVFSDSGVDELHQGVPLHQHVREGGAREDPHNLHSTPSDLPSQEKKIRFHISFRTLPTLKFIKLKSQSTNNWNGHTECQWSLEW